jgi:hypothetical protein
MHLKKRTYPIIWEGRQLSDKLDLTGDIRQMSCK